MDWQEWGTDLLVLRSDELSYALGRQVTGESACLASGLCLPIARQEQSGGGGIPCGMDNIPCRHWRDPDVLYLVRVLESRLKTPHTTV